jgi:S1-C subfamily serine protease
MDEQTQLAATVKQVFSNLEVLEERLEAEPESFLRATFRPGQEPAQYGLPAPGARGLAGAELQDPSALPPWEEPDDLLREARRGLTKIRAAGDSPPDLTPGEALGLQAIILLEGRPSILIENGRFAPPPAEWAILEEYREEIERILASVGRIEVPGHPRMEWLGTGFLVAPTVIMTNRHVAVEFSEKKRGEGWVFLSGIEPRIDFREEYGTGGEAEFECVEVIGVHPRLDMALLRVEPQSSPGGELPQPLTLHYRSPRGVHDRKVYVVGYPAWDGRRNDPEAMRRIFGGIYDVKRLQPGTIRDRLVLGRTFEHDASTLGGNSGSCVVDLETSKVLGLHFAGLYGEHNTAIALWKLRRSTFLSRAGVEFG